MKTQKLRIVLTLVILAGLTATASAESKWTRWFTSEASYPTGSRQVYKHGKAWPPYPRPVGPKEPFMHKYHRAHYWPLPYVCDDRSVVRQALQQQSDNGWANYTTLYDFHFDAETQELNQSGRIKLQWITRYCPERYRVAYVAAALDERDNEFRMANVKAATAALDAITHCDTPVMMRIAQSVGTPAEEVYLIREAYLLSTPIPRLPYKVEGDAEDSSAQ